MIAELVCFKEAKICVFLHVTVTDTCSTGKHLHQYVRHYLANFVLDSKDTYLSVSTVVSVDDENTIICQKGLQGCQ